MTTSTTAAAAAPSLGFALRRLYFVRFGFAVVWAAILFFAAGSTSPLLTVLVILYPLIDAAAVIWQLRSEGSAQASRVPEWINVIVSVLAAIGLGWASTISLSDTLVVWGAWAVIAGVVQLLAAILRRKTGGQVPLIVSGAISIAAGLGFASQGIHTASSVTGIGGYAILGAIFFLIAAIRLHAVLRRTTTSTITTK